MITILLGLDGLGLVSYLLVIYYQNISSYGVGVLTVLPNRIGDVALLMVNPLNAELNPIRHLLSLVRALHIVHVSRIRVKAWMINFGSWSLVYYFKFLSGSVEMELIPFLVFFLAFYAQIFV